VSKARAAIRANTSGIEFVALFALILISVPRISAKFGPLPIYFIDFIVIAMFYKASRAPAFPMQFTPFLRLISCILALAVFSEIKTFAISGGSLESMYILMRTVLSFSVFYSISRLVRTPSDVMFVLKAVSLGLLFNSLLMILTSLPMTRGLTSILFSTSFLEPAAVKSEMMSRFMETGDIGQRGRTLVGVSILAATFSNVAWPMAAALVVWPDLKKIWRRIAIIACILAPISVLMSYSRGPILGSLLIFIAAIFFGLKKIRKLILLPVVLLIIGVGVAGVESNLFFFDRLINRTVVIYDRNFEDERESERILAYVEPFEHVIRNPIYAFIGEGIAPNRSGLSSIQNQAATHALFAKAYYSYGMVAAILYMVLIFGMLKYSYTRIRKQKSESGSLIGQAIFASVLALFSWFAFGHAMVSSPRGAMLMFFVFGLSVALCHFHPRLSRRKLSRPVDIHLTPGNASRPVDVHPTPGTANRPVDILLTR